MYNDVMYLYIHTVLQLERGFFKLDMGFCLQHFEWHKGITQLQTPRLDSFGYAKHPKNTLEISELWLSIYSKKSDPQGPLTGPLNLGI